MCKKGHQMKVSLIVVAFVFSAFANAAAKPGSKCGLTDFKTSAWVEAKSLDLRSANNDRLNALATLTKQQLIITAKHFAQKWGESNNFYNTLQAVNYLRSHSVGKDLNVVYYNVRGNRVTEVVHYPGDNAYGVIFETGTRTVVAYDGDESIDCK